MEYTVRSSYPWRVGDATSQWLNVVVLNGDANESISGRAARITVVDGIQHRGWNTAYRVINRIFSPWQENHCLEAYGNDVLRAKTLVAYAEARGMPGVTA